MLIEKIINNAGMEFGAIDILNPQFLQHTYRTAFCWTALPHSLCLAMGRDYLKMALNNPNIEGIVTSPKIYNSYKNDILKSFILSEHPDQLFYYLHNCKLHMDQGIDTFQAYIDPSAQISDKAIVSPRVFISKGTVIHDGAVILDNTVIGKDSVIYHNVTIGTSGFFSKNIVGKKCHIEHFGGVKIGDHCIIHASSNVSRSVNFGEFTTLGDKSHVGIMSNISHDCQIGENCDISAKVCLAGRVKIGNSVWIGAGALLSNNVYVGDEASIKIGAVVVGDIASKETVSGNFAINHKKNLRDYLNKVDNANK